MACYIRRVTIALLREIPDSIASCELTHLAREPIDLFRACQQHKAYGQCLEELGCTVEWIQADHNSPDCVFVEDTVVAVSELAVMTNPGALSRRGELPAIEAALGRYRPVAHLESPGTLDGGDVLRIGKKIYVGQSGRSNMFGIEQLRILLTPHGYEVIGTSVEGCLHLKSACALAAPDRVLVNPAWVDPDVFGIDVIHIDPEEPFAANVLLVENALVADLRFPRTCERLQACGIEPVLLDNGELAKAEGALTCCSVILEESEGV